MSVLSYLVELCYTIKLSFSSTKCLKDDYTDVIYVVPLLCLSNLRAMNRHGKRNIAKVETIALPGIKLRFPYHPTNSPVFILTELSRILLGSSVIILIIGFHSYQSWCLRDLEVVLLVDSILQTCSCLYTKETCRCSDNNETCRCYYTKET
jgi:hypothetical protein